MTEKIPPFDLSRLRALDAKRHGWVAGHPEADPGEGQLADAAFHKELNDAYPVLIAELEENRATITRLRGEVETQRKAANHWFEEANRDHNDLMRATDALATARRDALEQAADLCEGYKRDASFDDSMVGSREHRSNQANIAAAILSLFQGGSDDTSKEHGR